MPSKLLSGPHNCNGFPSPVAPSPQRVSPITGASSSLGREFARLLDGLQVADKPWLMPRDQTALRLIGKVVPSCITMAGWNLLRRL